MSQLTSRTPDQRPVLEDSATSATGPGTATRQRSQRGYRRRFGMNFNWTVDIIARPLAFLLLGVVVPAASTVLTALWLKRRGLI